MSTSRTHDLVLTRDTSVAREKLWRGWTEPVHLMKWFCPLPWKTTKCEIDLRPGGKFYTFMQGPGGESHGTDGCYLEIVTGSRLVWTSALGPGWRPVADSMLPFTCILTFEDRAGGGARFTAHALHADAETAAKHAAMGFDVGWGKAFEQLEGIAHEMA
jgi:uncharacterized protein YndB with AHSA1/START domain